MYTSPCSDQRISTFAQNASGRSNLFNDLPSTLCWSEVELKNFNAVETYRSNLLSSSTDQSNAKNSGDVSNASPNISDSLYRESTSFAHPVICIFGSRPPYYG